MTRLMIPTCGCGCADNYTKQNKYITFFLDSKTRCIKWVAKCEEK